MAKIMIIDDESGIRRLLMAYFKMKGVEALEAESAEQALQIEGTEHCSAALLDMNMPGTDSVELLKKLLQSNSRMAVTLISGKQDTEKIKEALALGAAGFIQKPFDLSALEPTVKALLKLKV